jgi:hypothetical protein
MKLVKGMLIAALVSGAASLAGVASGPVILGPAAAPVIAPRVATLQREVLLQKQLLNAYRQVRTFWLSRGIVR